jgi:UDP-N-acetylmuramate dehydrogenase
MQVGRHVLIKLELTLPAFCFVKKIKYSIITVMRQLEKVEKNKRLKSYNTMRIDCVADYFVKVENKEELLNAVYFSKENNLPFLIIGKASNIIFPSRYKGVVIFLGVDSFKVTEKQKKIFLKAGAGVYLPKVSYELTKNYNASGLEWAGGVPGSVGGAVRGNAGAFGKFIGDYIKKVEAVDIDKLEEVTFLKEDCLFGYRESFFKKNKNIIILEVEMVFPLKTEEDSCFNDYLSYRKEKHPSEPSAGSIFKNIEVDESFKKNFPEITEKFKESIPAGFLIQECGLKGEEVGGAQISLKHANFIINKKNASGEDVVTLIKKVKEKVKEEFGVELEEEVVILEYTDLHRCEHR